MLGAAANGTTQTAGTFWNEIIDTIWQPRLLPLLTRTLVRYAGACPLQTDSSTVALHGTAMRYAAERRNLDESIEELRDIADGRNDILAQAAGITAGSWYAWPSTHIGHELIAAGMIILAGGGRGLPWTTTSWSGGRGSGSSRVRDHVTANGDPGRFISCRATAESLIRLVEPP